MRDSSRVAWILRIGVAGEFFGHGLLAVQGKATWIGWIEQILHVDTSTATTLLTLIGISDILVAACVLFLPIPAILLWAAVWGFWTALVRPLVGESWLDFIERFANWAAPLALIVLNGWPKGKGWIKIMKAK
ncbi:MAG: hypothetical protein UY72_C0045G0006 [Candidatus Uhrbacteria bacterium GW2011_GWD2_52_7]|uniref:DoxX family protein n=1 Tax=Candidatus Uhrbacteria bacterium GW2011_GWD2_52_7 TaxID=1618989 RepID=A0A0G1XET8_9BACT|nr:MAG: hypothetical protein UY72_C0045G0006 [Candidatus Uhrbacteria bacterium GW2011_GWD2_52_7]